MSPDKIPYVWIPEMLQSGQMGNWMGEALRKSPLLFAGFSAVLGIGLADARSFILLGAIPTLLLLFAWFLRRRARPVAAVVCMCALAFGLFAWRQTERLRTISEFPLASALSPGKRMAISGQGWISAPIRRDGGEGRSASSVIRLTSLRIGDHSIPCDQDVPCRFEVAPSGLVYGSELQFFGLLEGLEGAALPGAFDAKVFYFRRFGALARLNLREADECVLLPGPKGRWWMASAIALRGKMEHALRIGTTAAQEPYARVVAAMMLGARENAPEELEEAFRNSGTMHLFAVSGLHVAIVTAILAWVFATIGVPKQHAVLFIIPAVLFYALLTGLSPSALRAALMASVFLLGFAFFEKPRLLNSLGLAAILLLLIDPQQAFQVGFQLSFLAVLSIALLTPVLGGVLSKPFLSDSFLPERLIPPSQRLINRVTLVLAAALAVSIASWIGSAGPLAWHFQSLSPIGIVANVGMVPFASVIMGIAAASLGSYALHLTWLSIFANRLNAVAAFGLAGLAQFFAGLPGAAVYVGTEKMDPSQDLLMSADFVGIRGEAAALLEFPSLGGGNPFRMLVDTGGTRTYQGRLLPLLRSRGINRIDSILLTHGEEGHIGAADQILENFRPSVLVESPLPSRSPAQARLATLMEMLPVEKVTVERGDRLRLSKGAVAQILHPVAEDPGRLADDRALVFQLECGPWRLLFTSDSGFDTEMKLVQQGVNLRADVWIRGQHSETPSGSPAFVRAVSPQVVISSHSEFPLSERISEELRTLLVDLRIPLFETDSDGLVHVAIYRQRLRVGSWKRPGDAVELSR